MKIWQIQEAKSQLTKFVKEAKVKPQIISRHGKPEIIAMSIEEYERITNTEDNIVAFFQSSPFFDSGIEIERDKSKCRQDIEL
jgi:prevent-host-death family protein